MSKVFTDNIEKRTGGTEIAVPATGKWPTANIADDAITATQIAADAVGTSELSATGTASSTTFLRGDNSWQAVDALPTQTSNADKVLKTDGATATWTSLVNANVDAAAAIAQTKLANVAKFTTSGTAPTSPAPVGGDLWFATYTDQLKVWNGDLWDECSAGSFAASGGTETQYTDAGITYQVHTFTSSGNFVVTVGTKSIDILVVAGGGSGGGRHGAGGGAGGVVRQLLRSTTIGSFSIVIGAGAASPNPVYAVGTNGTDTTGFSLTTKGGGGGGTYPSPLTGLAGGCGGGGAGSTPSGAGGATNQQSSGTPTDAPSNITAYGNAGGGGGHGPSDGRQNGGGGGAGAAGEAGTGGAPYKGGDGGAGIQIDLDGNNYYWGGGGGGGMWAGPDPANNPGGTGGLGGGGGGGSATGPGGPGGTGGKNDGTAGAGGGTSQGNPAGANTGSGGGGAGQGNYGGYAGGGGAGGSGCVVVRYIIAE